MTRLVLALLIAVTGCSPYAVRSFNKPEIPVPERYVSLPETTAAPAQSASLWWEEFQDQKLTALVATALRDNLTLRAAWSRLQQAQAQVGITGSARFPQLDTMGGASRNRLENPEIRGAIQAEQSGRSYFSDFFVQNGLSFEIDLWRRIASATTAEEFMVDATKADLENTALILAGSVVEAWFRVQEKLALLKLLNKQIETSRQLLKLTELRFAVGRGSALDVYQQRQQLAATQSELPTVKLELVKAKNRLSVLLGLAPGKLNDVEPDGKLPELPPFPDFVSPALLLDTRPDLRIARAQLQSAEYRVAEAVADRFPRLSVGLNYDFRASEISDLFDRETASMTSNALLPLIDGGRRRSRVEQQKAVVDEQLRRYSELYLLALEEVENSLVGEKYQKELLEKLTIQATFARATLRESQTRYVNGLSEYLDVTIALQALQQVERRVVAEERKLLEARARLYRAFGGYWMQSLSEDGLANETNKGSEQL